MSFTRLLHMTISRLLYSLVASLVLLGLPPERATAQAAGLAADLFAEENLMAWCIVPFDAKKRGPEERAQMLKSLRIRKFAYDWRPEHLPSFDAEVETMARHQIEITAWWFPNTLDSEARAILAVINRHKIHPQLWVTGGGEILPPGKANEDRVAAEAERIKGIAQEAARLGCQVALYNHGGWFGEPENQLDVIAQLEKDGVRNVGIVYNFHHGHDQLPRFGSLVQKMKPKLLAVNLNGMIKDGEKAGKKILPLGAGDQDIEMLRVLQASGWRGPVGIIDHRPETDSAETLTENLRGLVWLKAELHQAGSGGPRPFPLAFSGESAGHYVEGKSGRALDGKTGGLVRPGWSECRTLPLVVECWTKLRSAKNFNILAASDTKASAAHWELYSFSGTGEFCVYQPGRGGNFASGVNICDDQWHHVAAILEESRVRLLVDGKLAKDLPAKPLQGNQEPGGFALGQLVEGGITCDGLVDEVKLHRGTELNTATLLGHFPLDAPEASAPQPPRPAAFFPDARPLQPELHPWHQHPVNRDRLYDFYAKQARRFAAESPLPELLPPYPGLDSGRYGHWGNQNEEVWRDARWDTMDAGGLQAAIVKINGRILSRTVCVQLGEKRELAGCFDTETLTWEGVWRGGFLKHDSFRAGMLHALVPSGAVEKVASDSAKPGSFEFRGFYRHGNQVVFSFTKDGTEWLESASVENGQFIRRRESKGGALTLLTKGGPTQWPQVLESHGELGQGTAYAVDTLAFPATPWKSLWHVCGHDFLPSGDAALSTYEGEVWIVSGIDEQLSHLRWRRFAAGLNQPLGLKVVEGKVMVLGRDQLTRLYDLNGDGEADFYEAVSRAYQTPVGGHDYLTGLETDAQGRYYFAAGQLGITRISADGKSTEVLATGFRNPNGLAVGPRGEVVAAAQEGDWTAASLLAEITPGGHYRHGGPKSGPLGDLPPTLYFPRGLDNSCGGQAFVDSDRWGLPRGELIHLSWGTGASFLILRDSIDGQKQGCAVPLPGEFRSGAHRGRFRPADGQFYVSGSSGWGTYTPEEGCFQRQRFVGGTARVPTAFHAHDNGIRLDFAAPVEASVGEAKRWFAQQWSYLIGPAYGSEEYSVRWPRTPGHDVLEVRGAHLSADRRTVFVEIPQLLPCHQLHLRCEAPGLLSPDLFLTLHQLGTPYTEFPGYQAVAKRQPGSAGAEVLDVEPSPFEQGQTGRALRIQSTVGGLQFAQKELTANAGERVSLTFENTDLIPHNWVLSQRGAVDRISDLADKLVTDPKALSHSYVPQSKEILCHTRLVEGTKSTTIHFQVPVEVGDYPFLCTFPGHTKIMRGTLHVIAAP